VIFLDENKANSRQVSFSHLTLITISVVLILLGILGEDILLNIAVSGPLILTGIGGLILLLTVESRHGFSQKIDIKIGNLQGLETSKKANSQSIELTLFCISLLLILLATSSLSTRNYSTFVLSLFLAFSVIGILGGRHIGSSVGISSSVDNWGDLNTSAKYDEFLELRQWLRGDLRENLSLIQVRKMEQQKILFLDEMKKIFSNSERTEKLINSLHQICDRSGNIQEELSEHLFISVLRKSYNNWLLDVVEFTKSDKDFGVRNSLKSLLVLPSIIEFLSFLSRPNGVRNSIIFNQLLSCSARFAIQLDSLDLIQAGSDRVSSDASILFRTPDDSILNFINFISIKSSFHQEYDFSPWWLLNVRSLLAVKDISVLFEEIQSLSLFENFVIDNMEEWSYSLSELFGGKFPLDETSSQSAKVIMQISKRGSGVFESDLIRLTWQAYQKLR
jgi:hypothetical protein